LCILLVMQADVFLAPQIYAAIERTKIDMVLPFYFRVIGM